MIPPLGMDNARGRITSCTSDTETQRTSAGWSGAKVAVANEQEITEPDNQLFFISPILGVPFRRRLYVLVVESDHKVVVDLMEYNQYSTQHCLLLPICHQGQE